LDGLFAVTSRLLVVPETARLGEADAWFEDFRADTRTVQDL